MAINIKGAVGSASPHGKAALKMGDPVPTPEADEPELPLETEEPPVEPEAIAPEMTVTTTKEKGGEVISQQLEHEVADPVSVPKAHAVVRMGMNFKFPIADYTVIGWNVGVDFPCDPEDVDTAYDAAKEWVEERINKLIAEQQAEG